MCQVILDPAKFAEITKEMFEQAGSSPEEAEVQAKAAYNRVAKARDRRTQSELTQNAR